MGIIDFHIVDDNVYSDTARALVMAYHSQDSRLLGDVMNNIVSPLLSEENGIQKMLLACVRGYHSMAFAMSSLTEMSFADIISADAEADYKTQDFFSSNEQDSE